MNRRKLNELEFQGKSCFSVFPKFPGSPRLFALVRMIEKKGFSLVEVLFATVFLCLAFLVFLVIFTSSNRGTVDSYQETVAYTVGVETLEWTTGLGYGVLNQVLKNPVPLAFKDFRDRLQTLGLGAYQPVKDFTLEDNTPVTYPEDYKRFKRCIDLSRVAPGLILVRVSVQSQSAGLFRKDTIVLEKIVGPE